MESKWIENFGLVFEKELLKGHHRVDIVVVGNDESGKTQLIQRFLVDVTRYTFARHADFDQYYVSLLGSGALQLYIFDVRNTEYVRTAAFNEKTVFLFCFDVDESESFAELESTWIPLFLQRGMQNMYHFAVSIEGDPNTNPEALAGIDRQQLRTNLQETAWRVTRQHGSTLLICSLSDRDSMLNVFQSALDSVFSRTSYN